MKLTRQGIADVLRMCFRFGMKKGYLLFLLVVWLSRVCAAEREFTVLVYNVENLFDLDGVALYDDYVQGGGDPHAYGIDAFLKKLDAIGRTLLAVDDGLGPDIVLFQEVELDRTPYDNPDAKSFLRRTQGLTIREVLEGDPAASRYSASLLLQKHLEDLGLGRYETAAPDPVRAETHPVHENVVFSRFPIIEVRQQVLYQARDLLEVVVEVDGHRLYLLNNHWKSGASNASTEPIRIQNAYAVRSRLEAILLEDPYADVIVGGDINSHYNQIAVVPGVKRTGVNSVLSSQGDELAIRDLAGPPLYNLWYELPPDERGSEVYQGRWGTLMQMMLTRGLYEQKGIQYVDNSFFRLVLPGVNVDGFYGLPLSWTHYAGGHGVSDHLPIGARFRVAGRAGGEMPGFIVLEKPSRNLNGPDFLPAVNYSAAKFPRPPKDVAELSLLNAAERNLRRGEVFRVEGTLVDVNPLQVEVSGERYAIYAHQRELYQKIRNMPLGHRMRFYGEYHVFRSRQPQFLIQDISWLGQSD